jgi:transposase
VETKVHFLVNQLSYLRRFYFWCTGNQDAEHTYEELISGLQYLGGAPREVLVDIQKAAVLTHDNGRGR